MFAPAGDDWMAIRDVIQVDGQTVGGRPDVLQELRKLPSHEVAETFKTYNSRFNLGGTYRNFNEPTLSLLVLDAKHRARFSFDRKHVEHTADGTRTSCAKRRIPTTGVSKPACGSSRQSPVDGPPIRDCLTCAQHVNDPRTVQRLAGVSV